MPYTSDWYLYIIESESVNKFYTGITIDVVRRVYEHNHSKRGAKFTKKGRPWVLVYKEKVGTVQNALKRERQLKKFSKAEKQALANFYSTATEPIIWIPDPILP